MDYKVKRQSGCQSSTSWWVRKCNREKLITKCDRNYKLVENGGRIFPFASSVIYSYSFWKMWAFILIYEHFFSDWLIFFFYLRLKHHQHESAVLLRKNYWNWKFSTTGHSANMKTKQIRSFVLQYLHSKHVEVCFHDIF